MAIDYLTDIKPMEDAGKTDVEIAEHMSSRTARPIPCSDAKIVLEEDGVVVEDPVNLQRLGTLVDHYNGLPDGPNKTLIAWFISHVFGRGTQISSNTQPRAVQLAGVLASLGPTFEATGTKLLALGGGQPDAGTTDADIATIRSEYQADQERQTAYLTIQTKAGNATAAAKAAWDNKQTPTEIINAGDTAWSS
jgi:hypothetical protein